MNRFVRTGLFCCTGSFKSTVKTVHSLGTGVAFYARSFAGTIKFVFTNIVVYIMFLLKKKHSSDILVVQGNRQVIYLFFL